MEDKVIMVDEKLRLRRFEEQDDLTVAYQWYQDEETVWLVDGVHKVYSMETLENMYRYLNQHGELYWIQILSKNNEWLSIGDVTFSQEDLPIVIGDVNYRGQKIGKRILKRWVQVALQRKWKTLQVREIYEWNTASQKLFESVGFKKIEKTEKGYRYLLELS